jgi:hypothetical protein
MYSWHDIASRTEKVYNEITKRTPLPLIDRLKRYYGCGAWAGKLFCLLVALDFLLLWFLEFCFPKEGIDIARNWPKKAVHIEEIEGKNNNNIGKGKGRGKGRAGILRDQSVGRLSVVVKERMSNGVGRMGNNV